MTAVWMRLRAEARSRWRAWLALAVFAGVFGGAVIAAAAGAARTASVVDRYLAEKKPPDIFIVPRFGIQEDDPALLRKLSFDNLRRLHSVADGAHAFVLYAKEELEISASDDPRLGKSIFPPNLVEGRLPDPSRSDEALANVLFSQRLGLHAGDTYTVHFMKDISGFGGGDVPGPTVRLHITGVASALGDFAAIAERGLSLTPAFLERYGDQIGKVELSMLRLRHGIRSYDEFREDINKLTGGKTVFYVPSGRWDEARRSFGLQAASLWILAGLLALVTILVVGQTIARQTFLDSSDNPVLRALGLSRGRLLALGLIRAGMIGGAAGVIAVIVATAASPLTPFGTARLADPDPALSIPAVPMLLGFVGVLLGAILTAAWPAWRAVRLAAAGAGVGEQTATAAPAIFAEAASRSARGPAAGIGVRMALEAGRGRTAVPVRTTIVATAIGLIALTAAVVVGASLDRLTTTPRLYGWDWDIALSNEGTNFTSKQKADLSRIPGVGDVSFGPDGGILVVDKQTVEPYGLPVGATVHPPILAGHAPAAPNEIALARKTMRAVGAHIGDKVSVGFQGSEARSDFTVVGVTVLPLASDVSTLGEGAWVPIEDIPRLFGQEVPDDRALVRFAPGAHPAAVTKAIEERIHPAFVEHATQPGTVVDFGRVSNMPFLLAGIVALLAAGTLGHGLVTAVRRRRRDLAVLKTLGLDRGQVRRAVAWQATATAIVTLALGLPLGVIVGRWIWIVFANQTGFVPETVARPAVLALIAGVAIVVANAIATLPARSAARTRPALVLRTE